MGSIEFEGRRVRVEAGDTVASALFRHGVRTFGRSIKYHRRRGLTCLTGDCANCLVRVDDEPGIRACVTPVRDGMRVEREGGVPSVERDLLAVLDRLHPLLPVGFYSKTFIRPRLAWTVAERLIRRTTGVGRLATDVRPRISQVRHLHVEVLVVGAGVAGLSAALAAAEDGWSVAVCDEGEPGWLVAPGPTLERIRSLARAVEETPSIATLWHHAAVGIYEGPLVPLAGPERLVRVHPERVVVATGALESLPAFRGNDLPGVWLGRGAARLAGRHGLAPGRRVVLVAETPEAAEHLDALRASGSELVAVLAVDGVPAPTAGPRVFRRGSLAAAEGRRGVRRVVIQTDGLSERIACDALVLSTIRLPRDALLRMAVDPADGSSRGTVTGAGEVVAPGCSLDQAAESGARAGRGEAVLASEPSTPAFGAAGFVCPCEDVSVVDLERAWEEGWRSSEILKRYTTASMGPCRGALCGWTLPAFVMARGADALAAARTTARPPVRPVRLEELAAGVHEVVEKRTALHELHVARGAHVDWSGRWKRPFTYGDWREEHRAVRERVSLMDVGTLGKFLIGGPDGRELLERVLPCRVASLEPGRCRYVAVLDEAGYVMDDGVLCALEDGRAYLTSTSGGAARMEAWLRGWADRLDLRAYVADRTSTLGAINVAGPLARELLSRLTDEAIDASSFPYGAHRRLRVAGVPCRAIRVGFVGELSFELHHSRSRSVELWTALDRAGADLGLVPHGLDALDVLRLEKGHAYLGQDSLPDDHPDKLGLGWTVAMDKPWFVGRIALQRMRELPLERRLVGLELDGDASSLRGMPLTLDGRVVGRVTSCARSPALGRSIGLGWLRAVDGAFPAVLRAGSVEARVVRTPFYDPEGVRVRA
ncbi:MAG TPA: FAD-dependent oxidoreductase [Actinomycetota bacterium]|nr:FAD-dependent oxidoreductase [Actinomycetota bacterium]